MNNQELYRRFNRIDLAITAWLAENSITLLSISLGLVFVWFGALKFFPGVSAAETLIRRSLAFLPVDLFIPFLGLWEVVIGLGFLTGRFMRLTILLLMLQMAGTMSPLVLRPDLAFSQFPFVPSLEGQYIIKNVVLISAGLVVGATVRGGRLLNTPEKLARKPEELADGHTSEA